MGHDDDDTMSEAKILVKRLLLRTEHLRELILLGFFVPHWSLSYAQSPNSIAIS